MSALSPSYLHKNRYGIFHFRCRIPISIRKKYDLKKVEIRKSLGTGNRTEALRLSRIMWVKLEQSDYIMNDFEADMERHDRLLREGRPLYEELQEIETSPNYIPSDTEDFLDWLAPFQREAIIVYEQHFKARNKEQPVEQYGVPKGNEQSPPDSVIENSSRPSLTEDFADIVANKIQQAGKKKLTVMGFQEAFETYIPLESQARDWSDEGYVRKIKSDIQLFIDLVKVINCCDLTGENIVYYSDMVRQLPKKYDSNPRCKGLSHEEMVKLPNEKKITPKTIKNKVNNVIAFLEWCEGRNYIDVEYKKPFKKIRKVRGGKNKRVAYTPDELIKLFNSKEYRMGTHKTPNHHWIPLIGLFTGARLGEICQLRKDNIVKDSLSGTWYFDFNDYSDDASIKTDAGIRFVPVHSQLRQLGFFKYYETIEEGDQLFPKRRERDATCKIQMRWFSRTYRGKCGVEKPDGIMKDFHSLRNTIINAMKQKGIPVASAREIVGHEDKDMSYGGYADPLDLPSRKKIMAQVKYPSINWNDIKKREWR